MPRDRKTSNQIVDLSLSSWIVSRCSASDWRQGLSRRWQGLNRRWQGLSGDYRWRSCGHNRWLSCTDSRGCCDNWCLERNFHDRSTHSHSAVSMHDRPNWFWMYLGDGSWNDRDWSLSGRRSNRRKCGDDGRGNLNFATISFQIERGDFTVVPVLSAHWHWYWGLPWKTIWRQAHLQHELYNK